MLQGYMKYLPVYIHAAGKYEVSTCIHPCCMEICGIYLYPSILQGNMKYLPVSIHAAGKFF